MPSNHLTITLTREEAERVAAAVERNTPGLDDPAWDGRDKLRQALDSNGEGDRDYAFCHPENDCERWTMWECDCGALNRASAPGLQHPCPDCGHPATVDPVQVMPVSEHEARLTTIAEELERRAERASEAIERLYSHDLRDRADERNRVLGQAAQLIRSEIGEGERG